MVAHQFACLALHTYVVAYSRSSSLAKSASSVDKLLREAELEAALLVDMRSRTVRRSIHPLVLA